MLPYRVLIGLDVRGVFMEWFLGSTLLSVCSFGAWENTHCVCHKSCFKTADASRIWNSVLPSRQWTDVNSILSTRTALPAHFPQRTKCHDDDLEFGPIQVVMTKYQQSTCITPFCLGWCIFDGRADSCRRKRENISGSMPTKAAGLHISISILPEKEPFYIPGVTSVCKLAETNPLNRKATCSTRTVSFGPWYSCLKWEFSQLSWRRLRKKWRAQFNANLLRRHRRGKRSCWSRTAQAPHWHVCRKWCQVMGLEHPIHCDPMTSGLSRCI